MNVCLELKQKQSFKMEMFSVQCSLLSLNFKYFNQKAKKGRKWKNFPFIDFDFPRNANNFK